jgi:PAS domain S-box-containing protein
MQTNSGAMNMRGIPPVFSYSHNDENFDLDIGLLSEYIAEDERLMGNPNALMYSTKSGQFNDSSDHEGYSSDEDDSKRKRFSGDNKPRNKEQMDRRRERNRVLAKKTRLRKKFFFESLQKQVAQLATENDLLKTIVKQRLTTEVRNEILAQCKTEVPNITTTSLTNATAYLEGADFKLMAAIQAAQRSFVITDPSLPDNPIIFASQGFLELSGYKLDEILGRNCRFMQGPKTDQNQVEKLRNGIRDGVDTAVCLLNYKRNGTQFYNQIFVAALKDSSHKIINYVGVQVEVKMNLDVILHSVTFTFILFRV